MGDLLARYGIAVETIPARVYEFTDYMNHDGVDLTEPTKIHVKLEVHNGNFRFDSAGADPQLKDPPNALLSKALATCFLLLAARAVKFARGLELPPWAAFSSLALPRPTSSPFEAQRRRTSSVLHYDHSFATP